MRKILLLATFCAFLVSILIAFSVAQPLATQNLSTVHITIVGNKQDINAKKLYEGALQHTNAENIEWLDSGEPSKIYPEIEFPKLKKPAAFLCGNKQCSLPIFNSDDYSKALSQLSLVKDVENPKTKLIEPTQSMAEYLLQKGNIVFLILGFWVFGFFLAFTPCVLPLLIIISGFLGSKSEGITKSKVMRLILTYVFTLSITYSVIGIIAAFTGIYLAVYFQKPWVLILFSLIFVLLALSLLDLFKIQLPEKWQHGLLKYNKFRDHYTYLQVIIMSLLATLIASPCIVAPLIGVLSYVGKNGDILLGGVALFSLGIGIGTPLVIISYLGLKFIPKSHQWQEEIKTFFSLLLLGIAIWIISRVVPAFWSMMFWGALIIFTALNMMVLFKGKKIKLIKLWKTLSIIVLIYGVSLCVGALMGNSNPLNPLQQNRAIYNFEITRFQNVDNFIQLQNAFDHARLNHKPIVFEFYAEWCYACKEIDNNIFNNPEINKLLKQFILLKVDITDMTPEEQEIMKYFKVVAPPEILFFDKQNKKLNIRYGGDVTADEFENQLKNILK
jgi:thiol:disulfide interchange protein DsbD